MILQSNWKEKPMKKGIIKKLSSVLVASVVVVASVLVADLREIRAEDEVMPVGGFCLEPKADNVANDWISDSDDFDMTEVVGDIWEKTFTNVPAQTEPYEIMLSADNYDTFGLVDSVVNMDNGKFYDVTNSGNAEYLKFEVETKSNVTVRVDLSECYSNYSTGGKVAIIVSPIEETQLECRKHVLYGLCM